MTTDLWGRTFLSTAVTEHDRDRPLVPGTRLRLRFADGDVGAYAGCNQLSGRVRIDGDKLTMGPFASTQMYCGAPLQEQDDWLMRFLGADPTWRLDGDDLVLSTGDTEIRLTDKRVAEPDRPLVGTRWVVDGVVDGDAVKSVPDGVEAYLILHDDGRVEGFTGCNGFGGTAVAKEGRISFSPLIATRMACGDEINRLESAVLGVLDGDVDAHVDGDRLTLTGSDGRGLHLRAAT